MIRCNNCGLLFEDENALLFLEDEKGRFLGCSACHSDAYLMDMDIEELRCSHCGNLMDDGFCIREGAEYYCSSDCLHTAYTEEEYLELYEAGDAYWSTWYED